MSASRFAAAALICMGIAIGSVGADPPARAPRQAGGYFVLAADLHVHSFFGDGVLPPWEIVREARRRGFHAIAITNHNQLFAARIARWSARQGAGPIVFVGEEITAPRFHMAAVGVSREVDWRLSAEAAAAAVHAQGGVAIAAHPDKRGWIGADPAALRAIDGAEVGDPYPGRRNDPWEGWEVRRFFEAAAALNGNLAPIGASDFHFARGLGRCATYVLATEVSERGILDGIRAARTVSQDGKGVLYGDPALVKLVEGTFVPTHGVWSPWESLAPVAVLFGFALIVLVK